MHGSWADSGVRERAARGEPTPRILVVDDEPSICQVLRLALDRMGFEVRAATTADAAMATLERFRADVLLLDVLMADQRGDVTYLLASAYHPHLAHATLFMSGDPSQRTKELVDATGCELLYKPFELEEIERRIRKLLPPGERLAG